MLERPLQYNRTPTIAERAIFRILKSCRNRGSLFLKSIGLWLNCRKFGILLRLGQIVFNPKNLPPHATDTCKVDTTMLNWTGIAARKRIVFRLPGLQLDCDILGDLNQDRLNCKDIQTIVMMTVGLCKKRQRVDGPHVLLPHMRKQSVYFCCNATNQRHNPHQLWHDCRKYAIQAKSG